MTFRVIFSLALYAPVHLLMCDEMKNQPHCVTKNLVYIKQPIIHQISEIRYALSVLLEAYDSGKE